MYEKASNMIPASRKRKLKSTSGSADLNPNFPATEAEAQNMANSNPVNRFPGESRVIRKARSIFDQQIKKFLVKFLSVPVNISNICTIGVYYSEVSGEFPDRIADLIAGQDVEYISEPCQEDIVRGLI